MPVELALVARLGPLRRIWVSRLAFDGSAGIPRRTAGIVRRVCTGCCSVGCDAPGRRWARLVWSSSARVGKPLGRTGVSYVPIGVEVAGQQWLRARVRIWRQHGGGIVFNRTVVYMRAVRT